MYKHAGGIFFMDTRNGNIYDFESEEFMDVMSNIEGHLREMTIPPTEKQMKRNPPRVGRNEPCPCGSGKKFKKCCLEDAQDTHKDALL